MSLVQNFIAPSVSITLLLYLENPTSGQIQCKFNYDLSAELKADLKELEGFGYEVSIWRKRATVEGPTDLLKTICKRLKENHGLQVLVTTMLQGDITKDISPQTLSVEAY